MDKVSKEVFKTFALALLRHLLTLFGAWLMKIGVLDSITSGILTSEDFGFALLGLLVAGGSWLWQYRRARYAVELPKAALKAEPGTSLETVKADVKSRL